jgi:polysaccharide biosynthesis protein PslH
MNVLWMIPKWTLPATDGARVATDSLIRNTIASSPDVDVDVCCLPLANEIIDVQQMKDYWKVKEVFIFHRSLPVTKFKKMSYFAQQILKHPLMPLTFSSFSELKIQQSVQALIKKKKYDLIVLDGLHLGAVFLEGFKFRHPGPRIVYRAHNLEVDLWIKAYRESHNPAFKLLLYLQSCLVKEVEKSIIQGSDEIAAIAPEDLRDIKVLAPGKKSRWIPLGLKFEQLPEAPQEDYFDFLFIGRLDWPPNRDGLEWILREVWPSVIKRKPTVRMKIVGSGDRSWLNSYSHLTGIKIVGFVDNINDAYQDCHFTIVPITYGSGTRIKVIESFAKGRNLISTAMGVQGAHLRPEDFIRAESTQDWIDVLSTIELTSELKNHLVASRSRVSQQFDEVLIGKEFAHCLRSLE